MGIFDIIEKDISSSIRNLDVESSGVVSSTKYFPVFDIDGKEYIFKPLSRTKPLLTPLFSYSEVYWSYLLNKYMDNNTPIYNLGYCRGLSEEQVKYYDKGCFVPNVLCEGESLLNILELFRKYPDSLVDIDKYENYCERQYDYSKILESDFFRNRSDIGRELAFQILCSVLRRDENYHYENVAVIEENDEIIGMAPMIDFEFSGMFMYPDLDSSHRRMFLFYDLGMGPIFDYIDDLSYEENMALFKERLNGSIFDMYDVRKSSNIMKNLKTIVELYPEVVIDFRDRLFNMREEVCELDILFNREFLGTFSSYDWEVGRLRYKEGRGEEDYSYKKALELSNNNKVKLSSDSFNDCLKKEVLWSIDKLIITLDMLLKVKDDSFDISNYHNNILYDNNSSNNVKVLKL